MPRRLRTLSLCSWLSRDYGDQPSSEQSAIFLDLRRVYMELRPQLRRLYTSARDLVS